MSCQNITPPMLNAMKVEEAFERLDTELSTLPKLAVITITDVCSQLCKFCSGVHKKPSEGVFCDVEAIEAMTWLKDVAHIMVVGSGEALCHPRYVDIIRAVRRLAPWSDVRLYTNGLGLNGKRLDATLECCSSLEISQNAVTEKAYNYLIANGNYKVAMRNLAELAERRPKNLHVMLRVIIIRETLDEVKRMVDLAANYGFAEVIGMRSIYTANAEKYGLSKDSFSLNNEEFFDVPQLQKYAADKGVTLHLTAGAYCDRTQHLCRNPWEELRMLPIPNGFSVNVCCGGKLNLNVANQQLGNIHSFWNHDRLQFIRKTVNNSDLLMANKLCLYCRSCRNIDAADFHRRAELRKKLRISDGEFFPLEWVGGNPDA